MTDVAPELSEEEADDACGGKQYLFNDNKGTA